MISIEWESQRGDRAGQGVRYLVCGFRGLCVLWVVCVVVCVVGSDVDPSWVQNFNQNRIRCWVEVSELWSNSVPGFGQSWGQNSEQNLDQNQIRFGVNVWSECWSESDPIVGHSWGQNFDQNFDQHRIRFGVIVWSECWSKSVPLFGQSWGQNFEQNVDQHRIRVGDKVWVTVLIKFGSVLWSKPVSESGSRPGPFLYQSWGWKVDQPRSALLLKSQKHRES